MPDRPDRRKDLIDVTSVLRGQADVLQALNHPHHGRITFAIMRLFVVIDYLEDAAGVFTPEQQIAS